MEAYYGKETTLASGKKVSSGLTCTRRVGMESLGRVEDRLDRS